MCLDYCVKDVIDLYTGISGSFSPDLSGVWKGTTGMSFRDGQHEPVVYIMASERNGTLYTGVTSDLMQRVREHKLGTFEGFTSRYAVHLLVYYESHGSIADAIAREKLVKRWNRAWKLRLIERENPQWDDLAADWHL